MAAGVAASFASTLASQRLIRVVERDRALWPYAAYRAALAAAVLARLRRTSAQECRGHPFPHHGVENRAAGMVVDRVRDRGAVAR
jgi:hypothetical protein